MVDVKCLRCLPVTCTCIRMKSGKAENCLRIAYAMQHDSLVVMLFCSVSLLPLISDIPLRAMLRAHTENFYCER